MAKLLLVDLVSETQFQPKGKISPQSSENESLFPLELVYNLSTPEG